LLYDTATGSLVAIDDRLYSLLKSAENESVPSTYINNSELKDLYEDGLVLSDIEFPQPQSLRPKSLCLIVAHACNMNCTYCSLAGVTGQDKLMKPSVAMKALDWITEVAPGRKVDIDFFGGEPLLAWETVKKTVLHGEKIMDKTDRFIRWSLSTNCLLLDDDKIQFCRDHYISLIMSLDGLKEDNDECRRMVDERGSFDHIFPHIKRVADTWERGFYVRGTYTKKTIHFSDSVIALHKMGISNLAFEPVVSSDHQIGFSSDDLETIRTEYEKLARYYVECVNNNIPIRYYHFELDLDSHVCSRKTAGGCGAGCEYLSVSPKGDIWVCHQLDGMDEHIIGSLDKLPSEDIYDRFSRVNHITNKKLCPDCWASHLCAGGCIASNWLVNGSYDDPYRIGCEIQKIRLEVALWIQSRLS